MADESYNGGTMDDMDDIERRMRFMSHTSNMMGQIVMATVDGDMLAPSAITYDHQTVGGMLRPNTGTAQFEKLLYKDLSPEQQALREQLDQARKNPAVDLD